MAMIISKSRLTMKLYLNIRLIKLIKHKKMCVEQYRMKVHVNLSEHIKIDQKIKVAQINVTHKK